MANEESYKLAPYILLMRKRTFEVHVNLWASLLFFGHGRVLVLFDYSVSNWFTCHATYIDN